MAATVGRRGRRYLVDARAGLIGTLAVGLVTVGGRYLLGLPLWAQVLTVLSAIVCAIALLQPQRRRQKRLAEILQDPSSSSSAFRLIDFIKTQLLAQRPPMELKEDIETVIRLRHFPNALLAEPFQRRLEAETITTQDRELLVRRAEAIQRERSFVRERVVENIRNYLQEKVGSEDFIILYGYSSTVCDGITRLADPDLVVLVVEDLQYGTESVREHEIVYRTLTSSGIPCHAVPFSELDHLLQPATISTTTIDGRRLSLPRRRRLIALLGCDAIDMNGRVLIPSVIAGTPSDSACLAEAFVDQAGQLSGQVECKLIVVGESYKVSGQDRIPRTQTSAPLRPSILLRVLHRIGLAVPFRANPAYLYEIESGLAAIITDAGVHVPGSEGTIPMAVARHFWYNRLGDRAMSPGSDVLSRRAGPTLHRSHHGPVSGLVLDWNGVIALDEPLHFNAFSQLCLETAGAALSYSLYADNCAGLTDHEGVVNLVAMGLASGDTAQLVARKRAIYVQLASMGQVLIPPGCKRFLQELQQRSIRVCLVTASPLAEVVALRASAELTDLLSDEMILSEVASSNRPAALAQAVDMLGVPENSVLLVDDTEQNIVLGAAMGLVTARIDGNPATCETVADYCFRSVVDSQEVLAPRPMV